MFEFFITSISLALQLGLGVVVLFLGVALPLALIEFVRWWIVERKRNAAIRKYLAEIGETKQE